MFMDLMAEVHELFILRCLISLGMLVFMNQELESRITFLKMEEIKKYLVLNELC